MRGRVLSSAGLAVPGRTDFEFAPGTQAKLAPGLVWPVAGCAVFFAEEVAGGPVLVLEELHLRGPAWSCWIPVYLG
jgi:hypothetical protein